MNLSRLDFLRVYIESNLPNLNSSLFQQILKNDSINSSFGCISFIKSSFIKSNLNDCLLHRSTLKNCDLENSSARNANFSGANLTNVNFKGADLTGAIFRGTNLTKVNFEGAILDNASFKRCTINEASFKNTSAKGVIMTSCAIRQSSIDHSDFRHSSFYLSALSDTTINSSWFNSGVFRRAKGQSIMIKQSNLSNSDLKKAIISDSCVSSCTAIDSTFMDAKLTNTTIRFSNLENANLSYTTFYKSRLIKSNLSNNNLYMSAFHSTTFKATILINSNFRSSILEDCKIAKSDFKHSAFQNIDLTPLLKSKARYLEDCAIDHKSIVKTLSKMRIHPLETNPAPKLTSFMESCGIPSISAMYTIDAIRSLQPNQLDTLMRSTFISYGAPDEEFARKLNEDLKENGVTTFFFPESASFGEKLHSMMRGINKYDRIILICSEQSLNRSGLLYEIEKTLEREAKEGGESFLIPVRIDDYVLNDWDPTHKYMKEEVLNRVVADFSDKKTYKKQFDRLLRALKKKNTSNN